MTCDSDREDSGKTLVVLCSPGPLLPSWEQADLAGAGLGAPQIGPVLQGPLPKALLGPSDGIQVALRAAGSQVLAGTSSLRARSLGGGDSKKLVPRVGPWSVGRAQCRCEYAAGRVSSELLRPCSEGRLQESGLSLPRSPLGWRPPWPACEASQWVSHGHPRASSTCSPEECRPRAPLGSAGGLTWASAFTSPALLSAKPALTGPLEH